MTSRNTGFIGVTNIELYRAVFITIYSYTVGNPMPGGLAYIRFILGVRSATRAKTTLKLEVGVDEY